jgi:uncharacterized protein (DUF1330 family)
MPAYIVATVQISDPQAFGNYARAIDGLAEKHGGQYVIRGSVTATLEGNDLTGERVVVLQFPDGNAARGFYDSETYQAAKLERVGAATLQMRLVEA